MSSVHVAAILLGLGAIPGFAGDATWNGGTASWSTAAQWTSSPVGNYPKNGNAAQNWNATLNSGSAALDVENITIEQFTLTGGVLTGSFSLTSSGLVTWTGGTMTGTGGVTQANGGISLAGTTKTLDGRTVNNPGAATWTAGGFNTGFGAVFNNQLGATFDTNFDGNFNYNIGGAVPTFNNAGALTKSGGAGTTTFSTLFNNTGTVNANSGTLDLSGGDAGTTNGDFAISAGAALRLSNNFSLGATADVSGAGTVNFGGGTINVGGSYNITGTSTFSGATVNFNAPITSLGTLPLNISSGAVNFNSTTPPVPGVNLSGGALGGSATLTSSGLLTWTGGTMSGAGVTQANGGMSLAGTTKTLSERTVNSAGAATWTAGGFNTGFGAVFNNQLGATFDTNFDGNFNYNIGGAVPTFNNAGALTKSGGAGTTTFSTLFNNTGTVNANSGTLDLSGLVTQYSGTALTAGIWKVFASSALNLPTTGTGIVTNQADITVSGVGSAFRAGASAATLEGKLATNSGALRLLAGRNFVATGAVSSSGILEFGGGTFTGPGLTNTATGSVFGFGTIAPRLTNNGIIRSAGGVLDFSNGILGGSGTVQIDAGSSMNLSVGAASGSSADFLIHNGNTVGSLNLGPKTFSVGIDYTNANFGTGNAFAPRANVSGSGGILAVGGTGQTLGGSVSAGATATPVMAFGKLHLGDASTLNYQINNTGASGPRLRGAIQTNVNGGNLNDSRLTGVGVTAANFGAILPGGNTDSLPVTFTASSAGSLTGQAVYVLNNFDNVVDQTLSITGSAYRYAAPGAHSPAPVAFGNFHVGATPPLQLLTLSNQAANDSFSETLNASIGDATGGVTTNGGSFTDLSPGSSNSSSLSVGISTAAAGSQNGTATISLNSNGSGSSDLGLTALTPQTVTVTGSVYRLAQPLLPGGTSLDFGIVHVGDTAQQTVNVNNTAANDGFSESLDGSFTDNTGQLMGSGSFAALAPGSSSSVPKVTLDTSTAGTKSGTSTFALVSNGTGSSGLANTFLASQVISAIGQVNNYATAAISKDSGTATFSGSGNAYTVSFGRRTIGETSPVVVLRVMNSAAAPADTLTGSFVTVAPDFTLTGFEAFSNVAAGQSQTNLNISIQTDTLGTFSQTITLNGLGQNTSGYSGALAPIIITLTGEVAAVPALKIQMAGTNAILSWPLAEQDWVLKKGNNLTGWAIVTDPIIDTVTEHIVTTPRGVEPKLFFRLEK